MESKILTENKIRSSCVLLNDNLVTLKHYISHGQRRGIIRKKREVESRWNKVLLHSELAKKANTRWNVVCSTGPESPLAQIFLEEEQYLKYMHGMGQLFLHWTEISVLARIYHVLPNGLQFCMHVPGSTIHPAYSTSISYSNRSHPWAVEPSTMR